MRITVILILFLCAQTAVHAVENRVYLKDGKIMVKTKEGARTIDYADDYRDYHHTTRIYKKWDVKEEVNAVDEALKVYGRKGVYNKKVWIFNKEDGTQSIAIDIVTDNPNERIIFTPDEEIGFYIGLSDQGARSVYGMNVNAGTTYTLGPGSHFQLITCSDDVNYIIVQEKKGAYNFTIYDADGNKVKTLADLNPDADLESSVCLLDSGAAAN